MARRPNNLETTALALELLKRMPRQGLVTTVELRDQLKSIGIERDLRTIQRQVDMLSRQFDIERDDRSTPYGYRWKPNAAGFNLPALTDSEALVLALAEEHLKPLLPASVLMSTSALFAQAKRRLDEHVHGGRAREWLGKVRVVSPTQPLLPAPIKNGVLDAVSNALFTDRWLQVDYRNAAGKRTKDEVMPLGLAQQGPALYLVCRFSGYDDDRTLALHRMLSAEVTGKSFFRPKDFDLASFDGEGRFGFGDGQQIRLQFDIAEGAGNHLQETKLSSDQTIERVPGKLRVTGTVIDTLWLWVWLRGFGKAVTGVTVNGKVRRL